VNRPGRSSLCAALLAAAAALLPGMLVTSGCSETSPEFDLAGARRATLTVIVSESVSFREFRPRKEVRIGLRGSPSAADQGVSLETEVLWVELTYRDDGGELLTIATDGTSEDPTAEPLPLARRAVLEALVARPVSLKFESDGAIVSLRRLGAALVAAGEQARAEGLSGELVEQSVAGLAPLLDDERVLRGLAGAGVSAAPAEVALGRGAVRRDVDAFVAGRGVTRLTAVGKAGVTPSGEASVACEGRIEGDAEFTGDAGPTPPDSIGAVAIDGVRVQVSTEYVAGSLQPLRGKYTIESPHTNGPLVTRSVEFILLVDG